MDGGVAHHDQGRVRCASDAGPGGGALTTLHLTGRDLTLDQLRAAATGQSRVVLEPEARARMGACREFLEDRLAGGAVIYGLNTGFGRMAETRIPSEDLGRLQVNLVRSHAAGVGDPLPEPEVRALMLLRANALAAGHSGCRPDIVDRLLDHLNAGVLPWIPEAGSVGASGDLAPLAHVALTLMGEGAISGPDGPHPAAEALIALGWEPLVLGAKEGLALINGTQATTGIGALALARALSALESAEVIGALTLEGLLGTPDAFRPEIQRVRPHPGQRTSAERLSTLLEGSEIRESHRTGDARVQDAYSLRCMPQVHGAAREAMGYVRQVIEVEINAVTDNPLVFPDADLVVSGGNFHAQVVAAALDFLVIAMADLASISERRIERLLNPDLSGLPAFLARNPGLESGLMIAQVTAADLLAELRVLAHPASVDSISTSAAREDHVSMGLAAARKARRGVALLERVLAIEWVCAAQAIEFRRPLRSGPLLERAHRALRERVAALDADRPLHADLESAAELLRAGSLVDVWTHA